MGFYYSKKSGFFSHDLNSRDMLHIFYLLDMVVSDGSVSDATELFTVGLHQRSLANKLCT